MVPVDHLSGIRDEPVGRRETRRRELRDRLFDAAVGLFVERGYEATTMESIAERASVARATVFNHFPQKARFVDEWGRRRRAHVTEFLARTRLAGRTAPDQVRAYLDEMARLNESSRRETAVLVEAGVRHSRMLTDPAVGVELGRILDTGQRYGQIRGDVDTAQAALVLTAGYLATVLRWSTAEPPFDLTATLDAMVDMVLGGLLP